MTGRIVPDNFELDLVTEAMDVAIVGAEIVVNSGVHTVVLDGPSALETGRRLILAADAVKRTR